MNQAEVTPSDKDRLRLVVAGMYSKTPGQPAPVKVEAGKTANVEFTFDDTVRCSRRSHSTINLPCILGWQLSISRITGQVVLAEIHLSVMRASSTGRCKHHPMR